MEDNILIQGKVKGVSIQVDNAKVTVAITMPAAMIAAATMAVTRTVATMIACITATGVTTTKDNPIIQDVADVMITTMTCSARTVAHMALTMSTTERIHAATLVCAHIANIGVALTTLASSISTMTLVTLKDPIHLLVAIMSLKTIT